MDLGNSGVVWGGVKQRILPNSHKASKTLRGVNDADGHVTVPCTFNWMSL